MKTINTILPIYDSLEKQDRNRTGSQMPILTPRYRLPAFQWKDDADGAASVSKIELIGEDGIAKGVNAGFEYWNYYPAVGKWATFISTGLNISSASTSQNFTVAKMEPTIKVATGDSIIVKYNLIASTGTIKLTFQEASTTTDYTLSAGENTITHTITDTGDFYITLNPSNPSSLSLNITVENGSYLTYFSTAPASHAVGSDVYFQYKGDTLKYLLPRGSYCLKITMNNSYIYYSDIFVVTDIYDNQINTLTKINGYSGGATFYKTAVIKAISVGASVNSIDSNSFAVKNGEVITFIAYVNWISGEAATIGLSGAGGFNSNTVALANGLNVITLTCTKSESVVLRFYNTNTSSWYTSEVIIIRNYAPEFTKITFTDTHDLGDILYHDGFIQTCFFETRLNNPTHEIVEVGEEKNGIFITEKLTTKYKYRIIVNISRTLYNALMRLPQHDTITITDEVGNVYTPKVGNIWVSAPNWIYYDVCRLEIQFNDNSEFVWTSENNNLT